MGSLNDLWRQVMFRSFQYLYISDAAALGWPYLLLRVSNCNLLYAPVYITVLLCSFRILYLDSLYDALSMG